MTLHDRIMKLPKRTPGQRHTVERAASMAAEADELMAEMAKELEWYCDDEKTAAIWAKYNAYKEQ